MTIKRALISVSDKTGLADLIKGLHLQGVQLISTGGTAKYIREKGFAVQEVSSVTGFPEILNGRVKTLHPKIHGGILAQRNPEHLQQLEELDIQTIDLVVVNLYPFRETVAETGIKLEKAIEQIDIGGPAMLRAAAKNFQDVLVVVNPDRYKEVLQAVSVGKAAKQWRLELAQEAFAHTAFYDAVIAQYLAQRIPESRNSFPATMALPYERQQQLRYGENPHQQAAFYRKPLLSGFSLVAAEQLHGKALSYNNILDLDAAVGAVREFQGPAAVIIKHNNPCGVACAPVLAEAYKRAYHSDELSAFGGIVALNHPVDKQTAHEMSQIFLEAVIAPDYSPEALLILQQKASIRLLKANNILEEEQNTMEVRSVVGGLLSQEEDRLSVSSKQLKVVTKRQPSPEEQAELLFAFKVAKHVKSNAIVLSKNFATVGIGAGQMNRVGAARIALQQAADKSSGAVLASDAFFPFSDTVEIAAQQRVQAIIQPGGSVRDKDSIAAADQHGIAMVFTGHRHFRH